MGRERREFKRTSGVRDANLIVVATEGEKSEPIYFEQLRSSKEFYNPRVHLKVIPSVDGKSSPKYVLEHLNEFKKEYKIRADDELWMVIDRDFKSWTIAELTDCLTKCRQKHYRLCISNPNFELWILLHFLCVHSQEEDYKINLLANRKTGNRTFCEIQIISERGHYNKANPDFTDIIPNTLDAIARSKLLTNNNSINLLNKLGTDINVLVERIINAI